MHSLGAPWPPSCVPAHRSRWPCVGGGVRDAGMRLVATAAPATVAGLGSTTDGAQPLEGVNRTRCACGTAQQPGQRCPGCEWGAPRLSCRGMTSDVWPAHAVLRCTCRFGPGLHGCASGASWLPRSRKRRRGTRWGAGGAWRGAVSDVRREQRCRMRRFRCPSGRSRSCQSASR